MPLTNNDNGNVDTNKTDISGVAGNLADIVDIVDRKNVTSNYDLKGMPRELDKALIEKAEMKVSQKEVLDMDENKLLEKYMDKIDADQRELKTDVREREERIDKRVTESESRMDARLDRIENMITSQNEKFDKIDGKITRVNEEVGNKLEDYRKFLWGIAISIFLAIAAMIVSLIVM